jgi:hypothetical protein
MRKSIWFFFLAYMFLTVLLSGCVPAPTPMPTSTPIPPTFTPSPIPPTFTPEPTATSTPDVVATQKADKFNQLLTSFVEQGYLDSPSGDIQTLNPTEADWKTGSWSPNNSANFPKDFTDFLFSAHLSWDKVSGDPQNFGCAIVFGIQSDTTNAQYVLDFNKSKIGLLWIAGSKSPYAYEIGKTKGTGRVDFKDKTETDFAVLLHGLSLYVSFDGMVTQYTLAKDRPTKGILVFSQNMGGSEVCKMTNMTLWLPK